MVCHAGRYTTVNKSDDSKLQYGLVNVQPAPVLEAADAADAAADAAAADVVEAEAVAVVLADGFESYKSATRSASSSLAAADKPSVDDKKTLLDADADADVDSDCGAAGDGAAENGAAVADLEADAVLPLTGG
jgi:hypothetical protein